MHANFYQHDYFLFNGHMTVFCKHAHLSLWPVPHVDLSICVVIQLFNSVSRHPYREYGILPRKWERACNYGGTLWRTCTATDGRLFWFCLLYGLTTTFSLSALLLRHLLDRFTHWFQGWYYANLSCDVLMYLKVWQARPFLFPWQCRSHIRYEYWKRSVLRKGLAYKHKQKQMQPSSNKLA